VTWLVHLYFAVTGANNEAGAAYGFWSGFGGCFLASGISTAIALFFGFYIHHTCHYSARCLRWGHHPLAGGMYKVCARHHPDHADGKRPRGLALHALHREWEAAQ
jgi:hypothetical protein